VGVEGKKAAAPQHNVSAKKRLKWDLSITRNIKYIIKRLKIIIKKKLQWQGGGEKGGGHSRLFADFAFRWGSWNVTPAKSNG